MHMENRPLIGLIGLINSDLKKSGKSVSSVQSVVYSLNF